MQPKKILVDLTSVFQAAQAYVMLSRVQTLDQLFILGEVPRNKLYADAKALKEVERLEGVSVNQNPSTWANVDETVVKICFLNVQSIKNKFSWIECDKSLGSASLVFLCETWLNESDTNLSLPGFTTSLNNVGRGHGSATFYKNFTLELDIHENRINITKLTRPTLDIIGVYRSSDGDLTVLINMLESVINFKKNTMVGGDFNLDIFRNKDNSLTTYLVSKGFSQIVNKSTHIQGGLIDHCYVKSVDGSTYEIEVLPKVYTDHDAICVSYFQK